jgi:hypothetical protein
LLPLLIGEPVTEFGEDPLSSAGNTLPPPFLRFLLGVIYSAISSSAGRKASSEGPTTAPIADCGLCHSPDGKLSVLDSVLLTVAQQTGHD